MLKRKEHVAQQREATRSHNEAPGRERSLRLWPGVVIVVLQWAIRFVLPVLLPDAAGYAAFAGPLGWLALVVWWVFFSRAPRSQRWVSIPLMVLALLVIRLLLHESILKASFGILFFIYATPFLNLGFVAWAAFCRRLAGWQKYAALVVAVFISCGVWPLLRIGGLDADFQADFSWRWVETPEEQLLAQSHEEMMAHGAVMRDTASVAEWPGFRGPARDGIVHDVRIKTDWSASPPVELWRRQVGPGWSSFSVHGDYFFTQEQRGDHEVVACYALKTGTPVWRHSNSARFWEAVGGAGPRGTPTLHSGRVYTLGATGIINVLNANDGSVIWSRNVVDDTGVPVPTWAFSSSPLVMDELVIVSVASTLIAYHRDTGDPQWILPSEAKECYSSPHLVQIEGIWQILFQNAAGTHGVLPDKGMRLWSYPWVGCPIVQPTMTADGEILVNAGDRNGIRCIAVSRSGEEWMVQERWRSNRLKPHFNDSVVLNGCVYGFDGPYLVCIDLEDGKRQWRGGRYGRGQIVLLADQGLLLVASEQGGLVLVNTADGQFEELARFQAVTGKTWNHMVLVDDVLLMRNAQEMVAFRMPLADG